VGIAFSVASRLCTTLIAREPQAELEALARECLANLRRVSHVVVRVADAMFEATKTDLDRIARDCGFEGRLVVLAEADMALGDVRIEWADGGVMRDRHEVEAAMDDLISKYLASRSTVRARSAMW
jgi:flagellar assembly protein FliH